MRILLLIGLLVLCVAAKPSATDSHTDNELYHLKTMPNTDVYLTGPKGFNRNLGSYNDDVGHKLAYDHTRAEILEGVANYLDADHDQRFTIDEIAKIRGDCLRWYEKLFDWISRGEKPEDIMRKCDINEDGVIDWDDFIDTGLYCSTFETEDDIPSGTCLCKRNAVEGMYKYVISRKISGDC